jgi:hypothetical protein
MLPRATFSQISSASQSAVLASKLSKVLQRVAIGESIDERERSALARGAELIRRILLGSLLIEKQDARFAGQPASQADVRMFSKALEAISDKEGTRPNDWSELFRGYESAVRQIADSTSVNQQVIGDLRAFFESLSELLFADVLETTLPHRASSTLEQR